nr:hypothetical protein [Acetobacter tropicalis]
MSRGPHDVGRGHPSGEDMKKVLTERLLNAALDHHLDGEAATDH